MLDTVVLNTGGAGTQNDRMMIKLLAEESPIPFKIVIVAYIHSNNSPSHLVPLRVASTRESCE